MLQNTSKTLSFKKIMVYKTPPGEGKPYLAHGIKDLDSNNNFKIEARLQNENKYIQNQNNT